MIKIKVKKQLKILNVIKHNEKKFMPKNINATNISSKKEVTMEKIIILSTSSDPTGRVIVIIKSEKFPSNNRKTYKNLS